MENSKDVRVIFSQACGEEHCPWKINNTCIFTHKKIPENKYNKKGEYDQDCPLYTIKQTNGGPFNVKCIDIKHCKYCPYLLGKKGICYWTQEILGTEYEGFPETCMLEKLTNEPYEAFGYLTPSIQQLEKYYSNLLKEHGIK